MPPSSDSSALPSPEGLRVMQVMSGAGVDGTEAFFFDGVCALQGAGLDQHVVIHPDVPAHQILRLQGLGIPFSTASFSGWRPWSTRAVYEAVHKSFRPNLAQFWTGCSGHFARRWPDCRNIAWFGGEREMTDFKACDDFLGITPDLMRHITEAGVDPAHTALVHTFSALPVAAPAPVSRASLDTPDGVPLLLLLTSLHPGKGVEALLEALAQVPEAYLWIAGEGSGREEYEALAKTLKLGSRVRFLGWRNDRAELLAAADLFVLPSRFESSGTALAEAWAAGKPLIAAAAQGPRAYVKDGENGLMVPVGDPAALAAAIARVIADPALAARLVQGGHDTYASAFTKKAYVRRMLAFYRAVANRSTAEGR